MTVASAINVTRRDATSETCPGRPYQAAQSAKVTLKRQCSSASPASERKMNAVRKDALARGSPIATSSSDLNDDSRAVDLTSALMHILLRGRGV